MNIIDIQDSLKNFSEDQLIKEMQMPSGNAPQFLVLSEIQRRKRVRDDFSKRQAAQEPTVAEEAVAAAGVPMQGIAGMSEAMAPQSAVSEGIGTIMPQTMRPQAPPAAPVPDDVAMGMRSGGLLGYGQDRIDPFLDEVGQIAAEHFGQPSQTDGQGDPQQPPGYGPPMPGIMGKSFRPTRPTSPFGPVQPFMPSQQPLGSSRPRLPVKGGGVGEGIPSVFRGGLGQMYPPVQRYDEGGVVKAQKGAYFPSNAELYGLYGQESGYGKNMYGSSGEIGPLQIMPTTAIQPGYGIKSLFPELEKAVQSGDYESALAAYKANKAMVDEALMSGQKVEPFVMDYLDKAEGILGNRDLALLSYNQGIDGTKGFEGDPSKTEYVSGVMGNQSGFADLLAERGVKESDLFQSDAEPNFMSAMADTSALVRPDAPKILGETPLTGGPNNTIGDSTDDTIGMPTVPGLLTDKDTGELVEGVDKVTVDPATGAVVPVDDPMIPSVSQENIDKRIADFKKQTGQTDDDDSKDASAASGSPNITVNNKSDTYAATDLVEEIKALQAKMEKNRESDKWLALAQAGMALMSSKEPTLLGAAGEAGIAGLTAMREANERYEEGVVDLINARAKITGKDKMGLTGSNVVSRINQLTESIAGGMLTAGEKAAAENEIISLKRLVGIPLFAA
jgi:hypothetical protein